MDDPFSAWLFYMAKDPAFLFYPNDYIGGTMGMTFDEKGAYIELLMLQFNRGHMTSHMIGQTVGQLWDKIQDKFKKDDKGLWYNERLDEEKAKRKAFTDSRRNNRDGKNQYTKEKKGGHMTSHMENVNDNVNDIYINASEAFDDLKSDGLYIESLQRILSGWRVTATEYQIGRAIQKFLLMEFSTDKTKTDLRSHLKRWINRNYKDVTAS
jgi:uncharacterized protein YdaU (DUF1376 family)